MRPSPDGPGDDARWLDALLRKLCGYAADFLNGPADKPAVCCAISPAVAPAEPPLPENLML